MAKDKNPNPDKELEKYRDDSGVSVRKMDIGLWLAENRHRIWKIAVGFLIALSAFFFVYSVYGYVIYFLSGNPTEQTASESLAKSPRQVTEDLQLFPVQVFKSDNHYDLAVKTVNPNAKFLATIEYCFRQDGQDTACGADFLLPGEEKYILALARDLNGTTAGVSFTISRVAWRRVDMRQIPDWNQFLSDRLNFAVSDIALSLASASGSAASSGLNTLFFNIKNQTAYAYYEAPLNILLFSGSELVGVNRYSLNNFLAGDSRTVSLSWVGNLRGANRAEIKPAINIMDDNVYLKYQGTGVK